MYTSETGNQDNHPPGTKWAPVVIDRHGERSYPALGGDRQFTRYRGSAERFDTRADAINRALHYKDARRVGRLRIWPWIADVDAEPIPNARKDTR